MPTACSAVDRILLGAKKSGNLVQEGDFHPFRPPLHCYNNFVAGITNKDIKCD